MTPAALLHAADSTFPLAVFQANATPPLGLPLCNGNVKPTMGIVTPLTVRGIVMLGAGDPIALCAVDWFGIGNGSYVIFRETIAEYTGTEHGRSPRIAARTIRERKIAYVTGRDSSLVANGSN